MYRTLSLIKKVTPKIAPNSSNAKQARRADYADLFKRGIENKIEDAEFLDSDWSDSPTELFKEEIPDSNNSDDSDNQIDNSFGDKSSGAEEDSSKHSRTYSSKKLSSEIDSKRI